MRNDFETIRVAGKAFAFKIEDDSDMGPPWENEDGHSPVSDWTTRGKASGELVLSSDRDSRRFYDFKEACKIARRDGWDFLPGPLKTEKIWGRWYSWIDGKSRRVGRGKWKVEKLFAASDSDINVAIRQTYALHRATMTAKQYAAGAAMADFERLESWCNDGWTYCGVVVAAIAGEEGPDWDSAESLWGIESDSPEYHRETAVELAEELAA